MKSFGLSAYAVSAGVAVILLAACGGSPPIGAPAAMPQGRAIAVHAAGFTYETLYRFKNKDDGGYPNAGVIAGLDVVYGTTNVGGPSKSGTVFVAAPSGKEAVLYSFKGGLDGAYPDATVTATHGELYGTTTEGGAANDGIVFEITKGGTERVLHAFAGGADGANPYAALLALHGALYGTTQYGGAYGDGTVFEIDGSGKERVIYSFGDSATDGENPVGTLIFVNGDLVGTTFSGGSYGDGTVFAMSPSGGESILYSFGASPYDAANPRSGVTYFNNTFYGTTTNGGTSNDGAVFKLTTSGGESVVYSFQGSPDGQNPYASLIGLHGALFGTTYGGGTTGCTQFHGCGTIFEITPSGTEEVLYRFQGGPDGSGPWGGLTKMGNELYGAASTGGDCCGTIFRTTP